MVTINLTAEQLGNSRITLTDAQLASIHAQESAPAPSPPPTPSGSMAPLPSPVAGWPTIVTPMPWIPGKRVFTGPSFGSGKVWRIRFTTPAVIPTGGAAPTLDGAEWQGQQAFRYFAVIRDSDGAVLLMKSGPRGAVAVHVTLSETVSNEAFNIAQVQPNTAYSLLVWNAQPGQVGGMFMDLRFQ